MSVLLEKARAGRANALAARLAAPVNSAVNDTDRFVFTAPRRHETPTFVSSRSRGQGNDLVL